jgi:hypothetical protein
MKKTVLYFLLSVLTFGAKSQTFDWQVLSTAGTGSFTNTSLTYSLAYFTGGTISGSATIGPRVYVATREVGTLDVLNAATGAFVKTITTASVGYKNTKIRATETGEIYSVDMKLGSASNSSTGVVITGSYMLDENSTAVAISFPYPPGMTGYPRMGEAFDVVGSGANATFFITGSGSDVVYIYKRNGANIDFVRSVALGGAIGFCSLSVIPNVSNLSNSDFFVSHNTTSIDRKFFKYNSGAGTYIASTIPTIIHDQSSGNNFSQLKYFSISGQGYLATTGGSTDGAKIVKIFKIVGTDLSVNASFELVRTLSDGAYTYVTGNGGQSDLIFSKNIVTSTDFGVATSYDLKLYQLVTRNAISAYTLNFATNGTLPVELTSFNAAIKNNQNTLNWTTASESNNSGFEVQSSTDGTNFNKIGFVATKGANGNSNAVLAYSFVDANATNGTTYYRLNQIDFNGDSKLSDVKFINNKLSEVVSFSVYPNPVTNEIKVATAVQDLNGYQVDLYNTNGMKVKTLNLLDGNTIDVSDLSSAIYLMKITKDNSLLQTMKVVKQ